MNKQHVHFIGIVGKAMAPLAKMFLDMGWQVTGSDQKVVFPPLTTYLEKNKINFARGYARENITGKPDLIVVGRSSLMVDSENPELIKAKSLGCEILSYPEVLQKYLVKKNSVVVAGTYGKTTISALVSWILDKAGLNPSFMIGGLPGNFGDGIRNTESDYSVIEGDETPAMAEADPPKFMFYKPKVVLLTAVSWDHPEIYKTEKSYIDSFKNLVKLIPEDGLLVVCADGGNTKEVSREVKCPVVWYSLNREDCQYTTCRMSNTKNSTKFLVKTPSGEIEIETSLLGWHNLQNITGAVALCQKLGISDEVIVEGVRSFKGVKERLEILGRFKGVTLFLDFAQHPAKVKESLAALRTMYTKNKIFCVFNPHASMLKQRKSLEWYPGGFDEVDQVIVTYVTVSKETKKEDRVIGPDIVAAISQTQPNVFYEPVYKKVVDYLIQEKKDGDVIVFMSSGGLKNIEMIDGLKAKLS
ncbi:MAG: Mur ligase family protein [bacterium]|nr:Mur ligase family protein [bacterium]